jgi:hypothetical protein
MNQSRYCVVILKAGPNRNIAGAEKILWEHGRRNFAPRAQGLLSIVCPVSDGSDLSGIVIFNANIDEAKRMMDEDPAVKKGVFIYEIHACRSSPSDSLPERKIMHKAARREETAPKDGRDLSEYSGALMDNPILDELEADCRRIRDMAWSRVGSSRIGICINIKLQNRTQRG